MALAPGERVAQIRHWKGLNTRETANAIADGELSDVLNLNLTDGGELVKRTGFKTVHNYDAAFDTFTRADNALTLGSTEIGVGQPAHVWSTGASPWGISGNRAYRTGATGNEQATVDLGFPNHEVSAKIYPVALDYLGVVARWTDSNNYAMVQCGADGFAYLITCVVGVFTVVSPGMVWASGDTWTLRVDGSTWTVLRNGVQIYQVVSGVLPAGNRVGFHANNSVAGSRFDDFSARVLNGGTQVLGANSVRILGFFNTSLFQQFIARAGQNLYTSSDGATWTLIAGGPWGNVEHGVQYTDKFYMVRRDNTIVQWDGTTATAIAGSPTGSQCKVFKDRLFVLNSYGVGATSSRVYFSNPFDFTATGWPATNYVGVGEGDGDVLVAVYNVQDYLIVFKSGAMWILYVQGSDTLAWILRPFNSEIGCVSKNTIVLYEGVIYFLSVRGVYQTDGNSVRNISSPVYPFFTSIIVSSASINQSSAFIWEDKYVIALETFPVAPTWASWSTLTWASLATTPWSGSGATYTYLVYHIRQKGWTKWLPVSGMAPHTFVSVILSSAIKGVYGGDRSLNGKVYKFGEAIYQDDTTNYEAAAEFKEFDFDSPTERKRGKWVGVDMRGTGTFSVIHIVENQTLVTLTRTASSTQEEQIVPGPGFFRIWRARITATHANPFTIYGMALHMSKARKIENAI